MKDPQIISIAGENPDLYMMVWGGYVIDDTTQVPITTTPITVRIDLRNVTTGGVDSVTGASLVYDTGSKFWSIEISGGVTPNRLVDKLVDRNKYVARVSEESPYTLNMREFVLEEFAVDNDSFEETLMRLPFSVNNPVELSNNMHMIWFDTDAHMLAGNMTYAKFVAPAYEGGSGSTYATDASRVTHRGAVVPYP